MVAAEEGRSPMVEYLVEKGADMEAKNEVSDVISFTHTSQMNICM